jgi:glutamyl/glutaminyl-tRNA synthetase
VNGSLHLGHLYVALVNEGFALESGGKFYVRFDDTSTQHVKMYGPGRLERTRIYQQELLEWVGIRTDGYSNQVGLLDEVHDILKSIEIRADDDYIPYQPELVADNYFPLFPFAPMLTAEKVVFDHMIGTTHLIRGMDLMTEYGLYQYFCEALGYPKPQHIYLPRLSWGGGDMSKRFGGLFLSELRADGYTPGQIREMLGFACLRNISNGWTLSNLKGSPRLQ